MNKERIADVFLIVPANTLRATVILLMVIHIRISLLPFVKHEKCVRLCVSLPVRLLSI